MKNSIEWQGRKYCYDRIDSARSSVREITLTPDNSDKLNDIATVAWSGRPLATVERIKTFVDGVDRSLSECKIRGPILLINCGPGEEERIEKLRTAIEAGEFPPHVIGIFPHDSTPFAVYGLGWLLAAQLGKSVLEIDCHGAQPTEKIPNAWKAFKGHDAALGERSKNTFNFQRRFFSRMTTIFSNVILGTNRRDASSGFQISSRELTLNLLKARPPNEWVSWKKGLLFLAQSEMRLCLDILEKKGKIKIDTFQFPYGGDLKGGIFKLKEIVASIDGLIGLWTEKSQIQQDLNKFQSLQKKN